MLWRSHGLGARGTSIGARAVPVMLGACFSGLGTVSLRTESSSGIGDLGDISLGSPCLWYTACGKGVALRPQGNFGVCRAEWSLPSSGKMFFPLCHGQGGSEPSKMWGARQGRPSQGAGSGHHSASCLLSGTLSPPQITSVIAVTQRKSLIAKKTGKQLKK